MTFCAVLELKGGGGTEAESNREIEKRKGGNCWQQAKHARLYSDLPQACKEREPLIALISQRTEGILISASAVLHLREIICTRIAM